MPGLKGGLKTCCIQTLRLILLGCTAAYLDLWASKQYISHHVCTVERKLIDTVCMLRHVGCIDQKNNKTECCYCPLLFRRGTAEVKDSCAKFSSVVPPLGQNRHQDCDQQIIKSNWNVLCFVFVFCVVTIKREALMKKY